MANSPQEIKSLLRKAGGLASSPNGSDAHRPLPSQVEEDLYADEHAPSRVAPSAEGLVTFPGLPDDVRVWLATQLEQVGSNGNGNGSGRTKSPPSGGWPAR